MIEINEIESCTHGTVRGNMTVKNGHSRPLFVFIFVFSTVNRKHVHHKISPMTGFEPRTSGIGDRSAN